jgi:hypothetical protein
MPSMIIGWTKSIYALFKVRFPTWPGIFFGLAQCGYTIRVTSQASYSPEYITPTQKKSSSNIVVALLGCTRCFLAIRDFSANYFTMQRTAGYNLVELVKYLNYFYLQQPCIQSSYSQKHGIHFCFLL